MSKATMAVSPVPSAGPVSNAAALRNALMLGWQIVELRSRIRIALIEPTDSGLRLSSLWRAMFNRIASLQRQAFPKGITTQTLYEPPPPTALPYLYSPEKDYANVGISDTDPDGAPILANFKLYDVTRRAINCLTLLYVGLEETLVPDVVKSNQDHLISEILKATQDPGAGGGVAEPTGAIAEPAGELQRAKEALSERTVKFLDAWHGFVRENYYTGGMIPDDSLELIAYEAGHSLSSVSWQISVATAAIEQNGRLLEAQFKDASTGARLPLSAEATEKMQTWQHELIDIWRNVFRDQAVIRLQHQIGALSSALDDAYYIDYPAVRKDEDSPATPNLDLPSHAIVAIRHGIDYWQRTVSWMYTNNDAFRNTNSVSWSSTMRIALSEQVNIWQTLITGRQSLRAFSRENVTSRIMEDISSFIQQRISEDFRGSVKQSQQALQEMAKDVKIAIDNAGQTAVQSLEEMVKEVWHSFWPVITVAGLLVVAALVWFVSQSREDAAFGGGTFLIASLLGRQGWQRIRDTKSRLQGAIQKSNNDATAAIENKAAGLNSGTVSGIGIVNRIESAAEDSAAALMKAFERGYGQIRIELDNLGRSVAVAYPLVEFFAVAFAVRDEVDFLTHIVWNSDDRETEMKRIMHAALGPMVLFIPAVSAEDQK